MTRWFILSLLPMVMAFQAIAQSPAGRSTAGSAGTVVAFERLQAKNRARLFSEIPDPRGQVYNYLDDSSLASGEGLSREVRPKAGTRGVTTVVNAFTSNRLTLSESESSIGTVRLRGADIAHREVQVKTHFNLQQPLRVRVRERTYPDSN